MTDTVPHAVASKAQMPELGQWRDGGWVVIVNHGTLTYNVVPGKYDPIREAKLRATWRRRRPQE